jgi:hypothetical protein
MIKRLFMLMCVMGCIGVLFFTGCTSADAAEYSLTVSVGDGVSGTPATGSYTYGENDTVSYSYTAQSGYANLEVTLDGAPIAASGVITMSSSHTLTVTATVDVRGKWTGGFIASGATTYFEVTFSDGIASGTARGTFDFIPGFGNGVFTVSDNQIEFNLNYNFGYYDYRLECTGTFTDGNNMNGSWLWFINNIQQVDGTWSLARD